jgi:hypothetical protein
VIDIPGAIESRDIHGALTGDVTVVATAAGKAMAALVSEETAGIATIDLTGDINIEIGGKKLAGENIYYKSDLLLLLALTDPTNPSLQEVIQTLKDSQPVIYPYNLEEELQVALVWLTRQAGQEKILINANSPEVATDLTDKSIRYPAVNDVWNLQYNQDPYEMQKAEWDVSPLAQEISLERLDELPGYSITANSDYNEFSLQVLKSLALHATRYEFDEVWRKPARGTDGGNQGTITIGQLNPQVRETLTGLIAEGSEEEAIRLFWESIPDSQEMITKTISEMHGLGGNWVVEAKTKYFEIPLQFSANGAIVE